MDGLESSAVSRWGHCGVLARGSGINRLLPSSNKLRTCTATGMKGYAGPWVCNGRVEDLMDTRVFAYVAKLADTGSYAAGGSRAVLPSRGLPSAIERLERSMGVPLF